jgi:hypothetical protein
MIFPSTSLLTTFLSATILWDLHTDSGTRTGNISVGPAISTTISNQFLARLFLSASQTSYHGNTARGPKGSRSLSLSLLPYLTH